MDNNSNIEENKIIVKSSEIIKTVNPKDRRKFALDNNKNLLNNNIINYRLVHSSIKVI